MSLSPDAPRRDHLTRLMRPESVAFVGASADPVKVGGRRWLTMVRAGFPGSLYPVHPTAREVAGIAALPSIDDVPGPIDLAVVAIRPDRVEEVVAACAARDVGGVVVITGGFGEQSADGRALEERLRARLREVGARMVGPNCAGVFSAADRVNVTGMEIPPGPVALLTQSGNLLLDAAHHARRTGIGFSRAVSIGNAVDLRSPELLEFLLADPTTEAVVVYLEGWAEGEARAFCDVVRASPARKPVIILQPGDTEAGRRAALSHTGSLAGEMRVAKGAFSQAGILQASTIDDAWRLAGALTLAPPLRRTAICVASDGGGHATLACDALERAGLTAPAFGDALVARLAEVLPARCPVGNPVDYAGFAEEEPAVVAETLDRVLADEAVGGVLLAGHFGGYHRLAGPAIAAAEVEAAVRIGAVAGARGKPIVVHSVYAEDDEPAVAALRRAHVPVVRSLGSAAELIRGMAEWHSRASLPDAAPSGSPTDEVARAVALLTEAGPGPMLEPDAYRLLGAYGLPVPHARVVRDPEGCADAVTRLDRPAALKVVSRAILHKSDVGGVLLNVRADAAADGFRRLTAIAAAAGDPAGAVLVAPMADPGQEVVLGAVRDPHFGPVVMVGIGGVLVEVIGDVVFGMAPLGLDEALAMLGRIGAVSMLDGYRGRPPVDRHALARCLVGLSRLISDHPEVAEVDVNPALCCPDGVTILDARVIVTAAG